jgi:hypothetical protein
MAEQQTHGIDLGAWAGTAQLSLTSARCCSALRSFVAVDVDVTSTPFFVTARRNCRQT